MRPQMGAPDDTAEIHGLHDALEAKDAQIVWLRAELNRAQATIRAEHSLKAAAAGGKPCICVWCAS